MATENQSQDSAIVQQLEYYFGDINLPRDKFLQDKIKLDEGWISIETLLTFNRLAKLSNEIEVIAKAVKEAESEIISLSEDGLKVRRNIGNPLPENSLEYWQKLKHKTVYLKGFAPDTTLDQIMEFAKQYGNVENVLMRRIKTDRIFKGSVFVTYKTREEAEVAQKATDKFGDIELVRMMQDDYWMAKNKETKDKRSAEKLAKSAKKAEEIAEKVQAKNQVIYSKGLVLAVEGFGEAATMMEVKEFFKQFGPVAYVVHETGATNAEIRFNGEENAAKTAWDSAVAAGSEGKVVFQEKELSAKVLEGEEEEQYWNAFNANKQNKREQFGGRGRGGRGRGGRGRGRGGRGGHRDNRKREAGDAGGDAPQAKKTVFADGDE